MNNFPIFFLLLLICNIGISQGLEIFVKDQGNNLLVGTTVQLTQAIDSSIYFASSNSHGLARFNNIADGLYYLKISYIGYASLEAEIVVKPDNRRFEFSLKEGSIALDEVTVSAQRPLIRYEYDRMIIDPEPISDISTNTLEVLESTPGLFVDPDGNIYLTGVTPATVYINGREQRMSSEDIANLLRSLPPGSIDRIEILRTPSTRYDAATSGGIVNVILKRGVKIGRFGSVRGGMNQGEFGNRFLGITINDSGDNNTRYLNLNYNNNNRLEELYIYRDLTRDTLLQQYARNLRKSHQFFAGYGINYEAGKNLNFTYDGRINVNLQDATLANENLIMSVEDPILSIIDNNIYNESVFFNLQQDFGKVLKLDTIGSEWDTKLSYNYSSNLSEEDHITEFFEPFKAKDTGDGENRQFRHFLILQSDLTYNFNRELRLETGVKSSFQQFDSDSEYYRDFNETRINDPRRTNAFNYYEFINAAYAQASKELGLGFSLIAGLRMEHTYMKGNQTVPADTSFVVNRADLFPYAYLSRSIFEMFGIELRAYVIYRRTINRPGYRNLNPYVRFVDQFLYETGNPALKPQFTDNVEINISFSDIPVFAVGRRYTSDIFSNVLYVDEQMPEVAVRTYDNLGENKETYFRAMAGIPPGGKYFFAIGTQYNYNEYNGVYDGEEFSFERGSWRFFTFHSLNLFRETRLTMSGFMMTNGLFNFYELQTFGQLNFGLTQNFLDKRLAITFSARDVLNTMMNDFRYNQGSVFAYGNRFTDTRRFGVNIRYNFGIRKNNEKERNDREMFRFDIEEE